MQPDINVTLTKDEYRYILESLLFSCSADASLDWHEEGVLDVKNLACKLRKEHPSVLTDNVSIMKSRSNRKDTLDGFYDSHSLDLALFYPETLVEI